MGKTSRTLLLIVVLTATLMGLIVATPSANESSISKFTPILASGSAQEDLPTLRSYAHLRKLIKESAGTEYLEGIFDRRSRGMPVQTLGEPLAFDSVTAESAPVAASAKSAGSAPSFSRTNVQVKDVDEADIVKTDGRFIYQVSQGELIVTRAEPNRPLKKTAHIKYTNGEFSPRELFIADGLLVVVGEEHEPPGEARSMSMRYMPASITAVRVYRTDNGKPRLIRNVQVEGAYLSSRRIGSRLMLVTNKYIMAGLIEPRGFIPELQDEPSGESDRREAMFRESARPPAVKDSAAGDSFIRPDYKDVRYFPDFAQPNYLTISFIELDAETPVRSSTLLGGGEQVYASTANLYVAQTTFNESDGTATTPGLAEGAPIPEDMRMISPDTSLFRFSLAGDEPVLEGRGSVPGTLLNQFSMDEHKGYFRVATTIPGVSLNNIYVLDEDMETIGRLEGLAPGERIYSARFMGDRAYLVTFKQVDPLFVVDLSQPNNPSVLGKLKIPGYSDYLHPLDDNHIIGFGKDTEAQGDIALMKGVKVAVFDVSDVSQPREKWKTVIGDRGTESALLHDHRALLHSPERGLLAFPVTVVKEERPVRRESAGEVWFDRSNRTVFQGIYVYRIESDMTLTERGRISHIEEDVDPWSRTKKIIKRALYIDDTLFTVSDRMIKANRLEDLREVDSLIVADPLGQ